MSSRASDLVQQLTFTILAATIAVPSDDCDASNEVAALIAQGKRVQEELRILGDSKLNYDSPMHSQFDAAMAALTHFVGNMSNNRSILAYYYGFVAQSNPLWMLPTIPENFAVLNMDEKTAIWLDWVYESPSSTKSRRPISFDAFLSFIRIKQDEQLGHNIHALPNSAPPASAPPASAPPASAPPANAPPASAPPVGDSSASAPPASAPPASAPSASAPPVGDSSASAPPASAPPASAPSASAPPVGDSSASVQPASAPPVSALSTSSLPASIHPSASIPIPKPPHSVTSALARSAVELQSVEHAIVVAKGKATASTQDNNNLSPKTGKAEKAHPIATTTPHGGSFGPSSRTRMVPKGKFYKALRKGCIVSKFCAIEQGGRLDQALYGLLDRAQTLIAVLDAAEDTETLDDIKNGFVEWQRDQRRFSSAAAEASRPQILPFLEQQEDTWKLPEIPADFALLNGTQKAEIRNNWVMAEHQEQRNMIPVEVFCAMVDVMQLTYDDGNIRDDAVEAASHVGSLALQSARDDSVASHASTHAGGQASKADNISRTPMSSDIKRTDQTQRQVEVSGDQQNSVGHQRGKTKPSAPQKDPNKSKHKPRGRNMTDSTTATSGNGVKKPFAKSTLKSLQASMRRPEFTRKLANALPSPALATDKSGDTVHAHETPTDSEDEYVDPYPADFYVDPTKFFWCIDCEDLLPLSRDRGGEGRLFPTCVWCNEDLAMDTKVRWCPGCSTEKSLASFTQDREHVKPVDRRRWFMNICESCEGNGVARPEPMPWKGLGTLN
ncbi:hypothetical protein ACN47E_003431 [Coniothyrium glycines]